MFQNSRNFLLNYIDSTAQMNYETIGIRRQQTRIVYSAASEHLDAEVVLSVFTFIFWMFEEEKGKKILVNNEQCQRQLYKCICYSARSKACIFYAFSFAKSNTDSLVLVMIIMTNSTMNAFLWANELFFSSNWEAFPNVLIRFVWQQM